ncbi:MAG: hypothetical protein M1835_006123 [Candelina submexicana]|nr:MAG: hypothetical protein M1835_006123 [Candelina submexicana]
MTWKANQTKSFTDPRTPWNRRLMLSLFAIEAIISFLILPFGIASAALQLAMSFYASAVGIVGLVNSLTHIYVIQTGRPVVLGAIIGVNTIWMLMWLALIACQTVFTILYDDIMDHKICDNEGGGRDHRFDKECTGKRLGYVCIPFAILGSINSIVILTLSIRALQREKRGIVAAPPDEFPVRTINQARIMQKTRPSNYMRKDSDRLPSMPKSSQSISLGSLSGDESRMEAGIER